MWNERQIVYLFTSVVVDRTFFVGLPYVGGGLISPNHGGFLSK